jgi:hypothetical protein
VDPHMCILISKGNHIIFRFLRRKLPKMYKLLDQWNLSHQLVERKVEDRQKNKTIGELHRNLTRKLVA